MVVFAIIIVSWILSYRFVLYMTNKMIKNKGFSMGNIENYATEYGKVNLFLISPILAIWFLWHIIKWAIITLWVCYFPTFGKKNTYSKDDIMKMVNDYLKENE